MKAVIYARYSSDNQREESIEGQLRECTAYCKKNDITILHAPVLAASIIPASSETGINAPESPPTLEDAITPPFLTASLSIARQAVVPAAPHFSRPISSRI